MTTKLIFKKSNFTANAITNVTYYTYTITPVPADAIVVLTASGSTQSGNTIVVEANTTVNWTVSKQGYITKTGSKVISADLTDTVTLSEDSGELILTSSMMSAGQANGDGSIKQTAGFARRITITNLTSISEYNQIYVPSTLKYAVVWFDENGNSTNITTGTAAFWIDGADEWINIQDIAANAWQYNGNTSATQFRISFGLISNADLDPADIDQYEVKVRYSTIQKTPLLLTGDMMKQGLLTGQGNIVGATSENPAGTYPNRISSNRKFSVSEYPRILVPTGFKWSIAWFKPDNTPINNVTTAPTAWTSTTGILSLNSATSFAYDRNASQYMISIGAADDSTLDATQATSYGIQLYPASYIE